VILRKMCREYKRLPPLCAITDELRWVGARPSGRGRTADVWRGMYQGSEVAIKVLRVNSELDLANLERVRPSVVVLYTKPRHVLIRAGQRFCCEVVLWHQFKHPNLLRLLGAEKTPETLIMVSEWMEHGTIKDFITAHPDTNRLKLVSILAQGFIQYPFDIAPVGGRGSWSKIPP
jgi:serine/threonine protein kinase